MSTPEPPRIDVERARSALWSLDAGADRLEWVRIGMAAKAAGLEFEDFNDWSATAGNYGGASETRTAWNSFKADGGINAGTLFHMARAAGWADPGAERKPLQKASKKEPSDLWNRGEAAPANHPYIQRKGGKPDGLRVVSWALRGWAEFKDRTLQGWLMVPVYRADGGELVSIQFIGPNGGEKLNAPGCRMAGTFTVGTVERGGQAYVVEGIGHAWSINAVTGRAAVVSFGAGNIEKAAAAIKAVGALPVIVPDRGKEDQARVLAARNGYGFAALPGDLPEGADINDLHLNRGADAVLNVLSRAALVAANENAPAGIGQANAPHDMSLPLPFAGWPDLSEKGQPLNTVENLEHMLCCYGVNVRYNVIRKSVEILVPGASYSADNAQKAALARVTSLCGRNRMPKAELDQFLVDIADRNQFNPALTWISSRKWDGRSRLADLYATIEPEAAFDKSVRDLLVRRWLISAVAAASLPSGFRSKGVLVFSGRQSIGKTAWFVRLLPDDLRSLAKEGAIIDPANKDTIISAISHWLVELGEVDATFRRSDIAHLKAFISQSADKVRLPYGRRDDEYPRRTVFFASVNESDYLIDDTGNTRWWTIPVRRLNYAHGIDMQQLWAEILTLYQNGERWWLDADEERKLEEINSRHRRVDPIEELILGEYDPEAPALRKLTAAEVLREIGFERPTTAQARTASAVLKRTWGDPKAVKGRKVFDMPMRRGCDHRPF